MNPLTITPLELADLLRNEVKHAQPIAFSALTLVDDRRFAQVPIASRLTDRTPIIGKVENPHYRRIHKLSRVQAFTGADYEAAVIRRREAEQVPGGFAAKARKWGERICHALCRNVEEDGREQFYLIAHVLRAQSPIYLIQRDGFPLVPIPKEVIAPFLPASKLTQQGVEREVTYRNYALHNLTSLSLAGRQYRVRDRHAAT